MVAALDVGIRDAALAAATQLFAERGFEATPLQAIADRIGATKQAVLHHFGTKEGLRDAVFEAMLAHWNAALPRLLAASTGHELADGGPAPERDEGKAGEAGTGRSRTDDRFDAVLGELRRFFAEDPDRARLVLREVLDRPVELGRVLRGPVRSWIATIAGYIRDGQAAGRHFADLDPEAYLLHMLLFVVAGAAAAATIHGAVEPGAPGRARLDRELARIARSALFVPRAPAPAGRRRAAGKRPR